MFVFPKFPSSTSTTFPITDQWGGYVIETHEGAIYIGKTNDHDRRFYKHARGSSHGGSKFIERYNGPKRVLELFFCETPEQATAWERATCKAMATQFPNRYIYKMNNYEGSLRQQWHNPHPCACGE